MGEMIEAVLESLVSEGDGVRHGVGLLSQPGQVGAAFRGRLQQCCLRECLELLLPLVLQELGGVGGGGHQAVLLVQRLDGLQVEVGGGGGALRGLRGG